MGFSYHIGIRHIVLEDAPVLNGNAVEDVIIGIQGHFSTHAFLARDSVTDQNQNTERWRVVFACHVCRLSGQRNDIEKFATNTIAE